MRIILACLLVPTAAAADATITVGGYLEMFYQMHFQNPTNRVTNLRGFDNRSRTFTLSNIAIEAKGEHEDVTARVVLQAGTTPATYYAAEPSLPSAGTTPANDSALWRHVLTASITARLPRAVTVEAGLLPSPIGPEVIPIKDNWNWSRSNLFFGLPFYHAGVHVARPVAGGWTAKLHVYNGWNNVIDNNDSPSAGASAAYTGSATTAQILYLGGIERGDAWRHVVDVLAQHALTDDLAIAVQLDGGLEEEAWWLAGAVYGKLAITDELDVAVRGDYFRERAAGAPIFWPARWVGSGTATVVYRPSAGVAFALEYRHDHAASEAYFGGDVATDASTMAPIANRRAQDTATAGVTAWF